MRNSADKIKAAQGSFLDFLNASGALAITLWPVLAHLFKKVIYRFYLIVG